MPEILKDGSMRKLVCMRSMGHVNVFHDTMLMVWLYLIYIRLLWSVLKVVILKMGMGMNYLNHS